MYLFAPNHNTSKGLVPCQLLWQKCPDPVTCKINKTKIKTKIEKPLKSCPVQALFWLNASQTLSRSQLLKPHLLHPFYQSTDYHLTPIYFWSHNDFSYAQTPLNLVMLALHLGFFPFYSGPNFVSKWKGISLKDPEIVVKPKKGSEIIILFQFI